MDFPLIPQAFAHLSPDGTHIIEHKANLPDHILHFIGAGIILLFFFYAFIKQRRNKKKD